MIYGPVEKLLLGGNVSNEQELPSLLTMRFTRPFRAKRARECEGLSSLRSTTMVNHNSIVAEKWIATAS